VLRKIFGPEGKEVSGWRNKLQNTGLHNLYSLPNSIRMTKSRMTRLENVVRMEERRNTFTDLEEKPE
jgi:hypothetical protein